MAKSKTLPVRWQKQIILRRDKLCAALDHHMIDEDKIALSIKTLLEAKRRVVEYLSNGDRETQFIPDANAIKNGIELWMELVGLRKAQGFESAETDSDENRVAVDAVVNITALKMSEGAEKGEIAAWLRTQDGITAVREEMDKILKTNAEEVVDV